VIPLPVDLDQVNQYVETHIAAFHESRLSKLRELRLTRILKRKNPYLFRAKHIITAEALVRSVLDAFLSAQEETLFGTFLEGLAVFIGEQVHGGYKPNPSEIEGIDLVFTDEQRLYAVEIKSGPHWGNSSQIKRMIQNFEAARAVFTPRFPYLQFTPVNGCCYGIESKPSQRDGRYLKLCGQDFWRLIAADDEFYTAIIQPIGHQAKQRNEEFTESYSRIINLMTLEFAQTYCLADGSIDWERLVRLSSQRRPTVGYPLT